MRYSVSVRWLPVACCLFLFRVYRVLLVVACLLPVACCLLFVVVCCIACRLLAFVCCMFVAFCLLFVVFCFLFVAWPGCGSLLESSTPPSIEASCVWVRSSPSLRVFPQGGLLRDQPPLLSRQCLELGWPCLGLPSPDICYTAVRLLALKFMNFGGCLWVPVASLLI